MTGIGRSGKSRIGDAGAGSSSSRSQSGLASGEGSQGFGSVLERMRSEPGKGSLSAGAARGAHDDLGGRSSGPPVPPHPVPAAPRAAAGPRAAGSRRRSVHSMSDGEALAPVASQPSSSGVAVPISSSGEEINEAKRQMHVLVQELEVFEEEGLQNPKSLEDARDQIDRTVNAGAKILHYYASLPPHVARSTLSDAHVRQYRGDVIHRADSANEVAQTIFEKEEENRKRVEDILRGLVNSKATVDQLSRSAPSMAKYHVARMELWDKKVQRHECMRSVYIATANLPSSTAEMRQQEEAALRLHSGWVVNSKVMQLESRINLAQVNMAPQAIMLEAPIRELLIGDNGQTRLLGNFIGEVFPAFVSTAEAVLRKEGRPLEAEHCAVLEGFVERLAAFASASHSVVDRLRDHQAGAGLPLELLTRIVDDAWITADEVIHLLELQPKPPAIALPADAGAAIPAETAGKTTLAESTTAPRKKGKGKSKQAAGSGSSAAGQPSTQVAAAFSDPASAAKVLVRTDLGTKKLVSAEEAQDSASAGAQSAKQAPPSMEALTQARQVKSEGARYVAETVVERLQTQPAEMRACPSTLDEPGRPGLLAPARGPEVQDKTVRLKAALNQAQGLAKALNSQSGHARGEPSQPSDAGVGRTHSGPQDRMSYARVVLRADKTLADKSADSSIGPRRALTGSRGAASGPLHASPQGRQGEAMARQESSLPFERSWLGDQEPSRSQPDTLARHEQSQSNPVAGPERRHYDHVAAQSSNDAPLNDALHKISFARDITEFSSAVVEHDKRLQGQAHRATFLQKAASKFTGHFVPRWEDDVRAGNTWGYATACNATSREPGGQAGMEACRAMAAQVSRLGRALDQVESKTLSLFVLSFSRYPRVAECRNGMITIAKLFHEQPGALSELNGQSLALLVNGFSKWPERENSREATVAVAAQIRRRPAGLSDFGPQNLANVVNGLSKWPQEENLGYATNVVAGELLRRADRLSDFSSQHLANLVNGFSKWPQEENSRQATVAIAGEVLRRAERLSEFTPQALANLVNGFSKCPQEENSRQATVAIAGEVLRRAERLSEFPPQDLASLVNGFSKWPEDCRGAIVSIARAVPRHADRLSGFNGQDLANLVNGFSKCPQEENSCQATAAIAGEVLRSTNRLPDYTSRHLANLVNGFTKWPQEENSRQATAAIAGEVLRGAERLSGLNPQQLANLLNGFDRLAEEEACSQAILEIARRLGQAGQPFRHFTTPELSSIANSLARQNMRAEDAGEIAEAALLKDRLHKLAHYLHYASDRLEEADAVGVTSILKALAKAQLHDDLSLLAAAGINRLAQLHRAPGFALENNLETMGNLCTALLPLARSPRKQLVWHRRQALNLLNDIQPIVEHKIEAHLRASDVERARGPYSTRCLALSIYQVLKARASLAGLLRRPYVEGNKPDLRARRDELQSKTKEVLDSTRELIESDLSSMSWNLIAQIEAEDPTDALDTFMAQNAATVQAQNRASVFDVHQTLRAMDHEPRPPQGEAGLMRLPVVDMQGRQLPTEPEMRYSMFHRLTSGAVKVVAVQLPGKPSPFMLARTLTVEGVPYRMDLFGGSKLKPPQKTLSQVAARIPGRVEAASSGGKLLAIPYAETAPGTAFEQLSRAWAPFKEAYYYTQRRGFAAPPAVRDLGPRDYALEGAFKLSLLPDRPVSEEHPFKLTGPQGPIALQPHDGCGFIKASLAKRMTAVRRAGGQEGLDRVPAFGEGRRSSLPASALQHYPRSEPVADEAREKAAAWLENREGKELTSEELFRTVTGGHIDGPGAVAVPSADKCLHVPTLKSETLTGTSGVLIGRSPYDKPNLRPLSADLVKSAVDGDPTATFLDTCVAIQYSFNVAQKSGEELAADDPTFFAKGILIVVPDEMWPAAYTDRGVVLSAEDVKSHSHWTTGKDRVKQDTPLDCLGILQATEVFAPGSLVAVPTAEQKKLDGDFDGDSVIIIGDRPQLYEHVRQFDEKEQASGLASLKPPKSHTPALDGDKYQFGRASQILAATQDVLETYSGLQRNFLAQSHEARGWFAERAIFGTYEGVHHELRRDIGQLLGREEEVSGQDIETMFARARREIEVARHPVAREMAELLVADLEAWAQKPERLPETVEPVNDAKSTTLSAAVSELLPDLADAYPATSQPRDRIRALIDNYPARIDPRPDGYNPDDLVQSANNLLSLGIKVGTDAYKSNTGARLFSRKSQDLQRLLHTTPGLRSVPYVKGLAASLNHGRFDVDAALKDLEDNPTLTASVMETSINLAAEHGILRRPSGLRPTAEAAEVIPLTPEEASERALNEVARATTEEGKITAAALNVAASLRKLEIQVKMPHLERRLRSERSIREQLTGTSISSGSTPQLISSAVRHVFEIPDKDFTRAFKAAILAFEEQDYTEIEVTNWFKFERPTFIGIQTVLATAAGYRFQVEFHTPASYRAKVDNHDAYKELQELRRRDAPEKVEKLEQKVREVCKAVGRPEKVLTIPHYGDDKAAAPGLRAVGRTTEPEIAKSPEAKEIVAALGDRPIVLVGMPGAGKSTIGPILARRLGLHFIDTDKQIEQKVGKSISEIFKDHGEEYFRRLEAREIAQSLEGGAKVVATGGGAVLAEQTRHLIGNKGVSIWFDTGLDVIQTRTRKDAKRPLLQGSDRDRKTAQLMRERRPLYQQADLKFVPPHKNDRKNADPCVKALHAYLCPVAAADSSP
ncbi:MAG: shikimate kinase [Mesorhizobium sp.]|nr:MAG: shikimate kinase [Mesorhizobium sp.]